MVSLHVSTLVRCWSYLCNISPYGSTFLGYKSSGHFPCDSMFISVVRSYFLDFRQFSVR